MRKMKLFIIACLIAVCIAAIPAVPKIPATFCGVGEIEYHTAERTIMGTFAICHDQIAQKEIHGAQFESKDVLGTLLRYDMTPYHMAYYIRGQEGDEHCAPEKRNVTSKLPPFFDWVNLATYEGVRKIREINYDLWGLTVADTRLELAVSTTNPDIPVFYNRRESEDFFLYSFHNFSSSTPAPDVFTVPPECEN